MFFCVFSLFLLHGLVGYACLLYRVLYQFWNRPFRPEASNRGDNSAVLFVYPGCFASDDKNKDDGARNGIELSQASPLLTQRDCNDWCMVATHNQPSHLSK
jgi:hypothetical protein